MLALLPLKRHMKSFVAVTIRLLQPTMIGNLLVMEYGPPVNQRVRAFIPRPMMKPRASVKPQVADSVASRNSWTIFAEDQQRQLLATIRGTLCGPAMAHSVQSRSLVLQ